MEKDIFDWRWNDEKSSHEYQLVVDRDPKSGYYKQEGDNLVFRNSEGKDDTYPLHLYLKLIFNERFSRCDATEIEDFLNYHFQKYDGDPKSFLKYVRAAILTSHNVNEFDPNPEGKKEVGMLWIKEMIQEINSTTPEIRSFKNNQSLNNIQEKSLDDIFNKSKMTKSEFLKRLRLYGFIDEENVWRKEKADLLGLMRYLIEQTTFITVKKYATLQDILATEIHFDKIKKPTQPVFKDYIDQFERVFPEPNK